jgi:hypothetical protein
MRATRSSLIPALRSNFASLLFSWRASTAPRFLEMCFCTFCSDLGMMYLIRQGQLYQPPIPLMVDLRLMGDFFFFWLAETQGGGGGDESASKATNQEYTFASRLRRVLGRDERLDRQSMSNIPFLLLSRHSLMVTLAAASLISRTCAPRPLLSLGLLLMLH